MIIGKFQIDAPAKENQRRSEKQSGEKIELIVLIKQAIKR
jgi:hypothetical protein